MDLDSLADKVVQEMGARCGETVARIAEPVWPDDGAPRYFIGHLAERMLADPDGFAGQAGHRYNIDLVCLPADEADDPMPLDSYALIAAVEEVWRLDSVNPVMLEMRPAREPWVLDKSLVMPGATPGMLCEVLAGILRPGEGGA